MQGFEETQRRLLDVQALAGELLASVSAFAFLPEHREQHFPDAMMEELFAVRRGRTSSPASVIGSILVLQAPEDLFDCGTVEVLTFGLR